jgi:hypothetical protein
MEHLDCSKDLGVVFTSSLSAVDQNMLLSGVDIDSAQSIRGDHLSPVDFADALSLEVPNLKAAGADGDELVLVL